MAVSIAEIIVLSLLADWVLRRLRLPGLIGMLFVGVLFGPHVLNLVDPSLMAIGADLRLIALIVILLRAGLELSRQTLHRVGGRALLLAFVPATLEGVAIMLAGPALLGLTHMESALLGSVLAAVSPAVVVPGMIRFIRERRGAQKEIPSMILAAASVDDVYVITVHSVLVGIYTGQQVNIAWRAAGVPLSLVLGVLVGAGAGLALYWLFDRFNPRATKRVLALIAVSVLLVRAEHIAASVVPFAALVGAMAIGFVILEKRESMAHEISGKLGKVWVFAEIVLFSMVGAQVDVGVAWGAGLAGLGVIGLGLLTRSAGVLLCLVRSELNLRERLFVALAYSPKATVQAAIGAGPLAAMAMAGMDTGAGEVILAVAVLSIVVTAPLGAWGIAFVGPRVLQVAPPGESASQAAAEQSDPSAEAF